MTYPGQLVRLFCRSTAFWRASDCTSVTPKFSQNDMSVESVSSKVDIGLTLKNCGRFDESEVGLQKRWTSRK